MKITIAIVHDHRGRTPEGKPGMLEIRITRERKHIYISTGIRVRKSEWVAGRIVGPIGAKSLNDRLEVIYQKVNDEVNACDRDGRELNSEDIRKKVFAVVEAASDEPTFLDWIAHQIPKLRIKEGTMKHYSSLQNRLDEYGGIRKWQDVTTEKIMDFDAWLHTLRPPKGEQEGPVAYGRLGDGLSDSAIYNYHKSLKALINRAILYDKIDTNPYFRIRGQLKRGDRENVEYLTEDEMRRFEAVVLPTGTLLDAAHDLFIFQMYTGLSYSDTQAFDISDYKWDGQAWKNTGERIKTGVPYVSQLLPPVVRVLEKNGYKIPKIDNTDYNKMLKALGVMAGIKTPLHSHLARHTFATWMLRNGVKIENVSRMLGHTNIKQTQRYAKVLAQSVHDDFEMIAAKMK
jgi:integrase